MVSIPGWQLFAGTPALLLGNMPHISLGKAVLGSGGIGTAAKINDNGYYYDTTDPGAWAALAGDWIAINLGAGPTTILVAINDDQAAPGSYIATDIFESYRLQVAPDVAGSPGTWTTAVTVTGNNLMNREHLISFSGYAWLRLVIDTFSATVNPLVGARVGEMDVWDASASTINTFAFLGDSLTVRGTSREVYFGGGSRPSFQDKLLAYTGKYTMQLCVGVYGEGAAYWAANIASALAAFPDAKYWPIGLGTNDAVAMPGALSTWIADMTTVINAITAAGRTPILARIPYTGAAGWGGGDYNTCQIRYLNDNGINALYGTTGVRAGPDLYQIFYDNRVAYAVTTDPHWNEDGTRAWADAWALSLL